MACFSFKTSMYDNVDKEKFNMGFKGITNSESGEVLPHRELAGSGDALCTGFWEWCAGPFICNTDTNT